MFGNASPHLTTRRSFLGGVGILALARPALASSTAASATSTSVDDRLTYQSRLQERLADAGGGAFKLDFAHGLLAEANRFRAVNGLAPYAWDEGLAASAQAHVADMAQRRYFDHTSPEGYSHLDRVSLVTRELCGRTAENLVWRGNDPRRQTPAGFEALWEQSDGHRHNLLRPTFTSAGYGVVQIGARYYAAGVYSDAALRLKQSLPLHISDARSLSSYIDDCSPSVRSFAVTAPFAQATEVFAAGGDHARLAPGAWQLRPLVASENRLDVLSGPTFFIVS